jgi:hypothetical protein
MSRGDKCLAALEQLLERQHKALLAGDIGVLAVMPEQLERAISDAIRDRPDIDGMRKITRLAEQNARLLKSAQQGLSVGAGLTSKRTATSLTTYDATGSQTDSQRGGRLLSRL